MQGRGESIGSGLAFEFAPAAIFGSAVGFSAATWLAYPPFSITPLAMGAASFGLVWIALKRFGSRQQAFPLTEFERPELEIQLSAVAELLEQADVVGIVEQLGASTVEDTVPSEELVLDDVLDAVEQESRVIQLFEPSDTAGEMQARIDRHLHSANRQMRPDATQELHDALAALRRSLR